MDISGVQSLTLARGQRNLDSHHSFLAEHKYTIRLYKNVSPQLINTPTSQLCVLLYLSFYPHIWAVLTMNRWESHIKLEEKDPQHSNFPRQKKKMLFFCIVCAPLDESSQPPKALGSCKKDIQFKSVKHLGKWWCAQAKEIICLWNHPLMHLAAGNRIVGKWSISRCLNINNNKF